MNRKKKSKNILIIYFINLILTIMKKSLFFVAAASALMLTACSSDSDVLQSAAQLQPSSPKAVGFDVYTQGSTEVTRAGLTGTMTTGRLQRTEQNGGGFGVYAFLTEDSNNGAGEANATSYVPTAGQKPNFMVNEKILWNNSSLGWYYNPLKYWPNETDHDSQSTNATMEGSDKHLDRLTFFAYDPYVAAGSGTTGITYITDKNGQVNSLNVVNPSIRWTASDTPDTDFNPNQGVDLLWGVAPSGGLSYTAVNGWTVTRDEGKPLVNMIKPDVNTSMKFLFQHALARFGINVVAAVDQIAPGGKLDPNTKITIESVKITGPFGTAGMLDLNNETKASVANWKEIGGVDVTAHPTSISATNGTIMVAANKTNNAIATHLRWEKNATPANEHIVPEPQTHVGVTTAKQDLLAPSTKWFNKLGSKPAYNPGKVYYTTEAGTTPVAAATYTTVAEDQYYTEATDVYTRVADATTLTAPAYPNAYTATAYYKLREIAAYNSDNFASAPVAGAKYYTKSGDTYTNVATPTWGSGSTTYYIVEGQQVLASEIPFAYADGDFYEAERNYLYVVPTNAALDVNFGGVVPGNEATLRTITVQIEYYISTEDSKLNAGRAETKNVITKEVVLPSLSNGKSYMLNMVLGLTSVKIEAEVDDWKVENVQTDLPQNTAE